MSALDRAIKLFNSKRQLAHKLGVSAMAVTKWGQSRVPLERAFEIERLTDGEVLARDLRPDVFDQLEDSPSEDIAEG